MTSIESAYDIAGTVYERRRARGDSPGEAMAYAAKVLRANLGANTRDTLVPSEAIAIATAVAVANRTTLKTLRSDSRFGVIVYIRDKAAWKLREAGYSYPMIGRVLRRDHSSMIIAVRRHTARMAAMEVKAA